MSQKTMIAMLEEAEDVLRRVGCDMTAANIRKVLQAQQVEPRCACGDSFTSDAVCANCLTAQQQAEPVAWMMFDRHGTRTGWTSEKEYTRHAFRSVPLYAQPPAVAVPDGYALVPIEPTPEMVAAGAEGDSQFYDHASFVYRAMLAAAPQAVATGWIDPNDKTQKQYLPHIGEPVLFCHGGVTYYGVHTGGSFETVNGFAVKFFETWDCLWMYPPAAAQKGGA